MTTLVAGIGNPILSDDGVGWVVAKEVAKIIGENDPNLFVNSFSLSGIALMEQMVGFQKVILIDSLNTCKFPVGKVQSFPLSDVNDLFFGHSASPHDLSLKKALVLGRKLNANLPNDREIYLVTIEAHHITDFGEKLTPEIEEAVPNAVQEVLRLLTILN